MRLIFGILLFVLAAALSGCSVIAKRSGKPMGLTTSRLLLCYILPIVGNAIIILSGQRRLSMIGAYCYYLGMDVLIAGMLHFTFVYCQISWPGKTLRNLLYGLFLADVIQLLLNPFTHHAFDLVPAEVDGFDYYTLVPHLGQTLHRLLDYGFLAVILIVFIVRVIRAPRLQAERYSVILAVIALVSVWETAYIFSGSPIDRSMVGFGVVALLIFYFTLYYRPMRLLDRMLGRVVAEQQDAIFFFDPNQKCIWMNPAGGTLLKLKPEETEMAGKRLEKYFGSRHTGEDTWSDQVIMNMDDGRHICQLSKRPLIDQRQQMNGFFITVRDETEERHEMERKLYEARHDSLTGLFNRDYLYEQTRELLNRDPDTEYLVIYTDINNFKVINDIYGYTFGDFVLRKVAEWIREDVPEKSVCGRIGGDVFGVCLPADQFDQEHVESKLRDFPVDDGRTKYRLFAHIGIYRVTDRELNVSVMYDRAHLALDTIKEQYHTISAWYEDTLREQVLWNRQISGELQDALRDGQLQPWLQPIVDRNGVTIGAEALVRWIHPTDGIRPPFCFIPVFEENGMIADVDLHIWRNCCEILQKWQEAGSRRFISVNISPKDFQFLNVGAALKHLVREYGIDPGRLRLEVTETALMTEPEKRMKMLRDLQGFGFMIEMDDFGSGYSSLNMLKEMPVDILKIDMAFLRRTDESNRERGKAIMREIIVLARELGITSLTEGVETEEQFAKLLDMGCQLYQGYYFAKPMPLRDFEAQYGTAV